MSPNCHWAGWCTGLRPFCAAFQKVTDRVLPTWGAGQFSFMQTWNNDIKLSDKAAGITRRQLAKKATAQNTKLWKTGWFTHLTKQACVILTDRVWPAWPSDASCTAARTLADATRPPHHPPPVVNTDVKADTEHSLTNDKWPCITSYIACHPCPSWAKWNPDWGNKLLSHRADSTM